MKTIILGILVSFVGLSSCTRVHPLKKVILVDRYTFWGLRHDSCTLTVDGGQDVRIEKSSEEVGSWSSPVYILSLSSDGKRIELARSGSEKKTKQWRDSLNSFHATGENFNIIQLPLSPALYAGIFILLLGIGLRKGLVRGPVV